MALYKFDIILYCRLFLSSVPCTNVRSSWKCRSCSLQEIKLLQTDRALTAHTIRRRGHVQ